MNEKVKLVTYISKDVLFDLEGRIEFLNIFKIKMKVKNLKACTVKALS